MGMCYQLWSAATAALNTGPPSMIASSATAGTRETIMQIKGTMLYRIKEWGYTLSQIPGAACDIELIDTGAVGATLPNAFAVGDIVKFNDVNSADTPPFTLGTSASGYGATTGANEGTITATRLLDYQRESGIYIKKQIPLGLEPEVPASNYLRMRITPSTSVAVSIVGYVLIET